jgi:hypothetical protein
MKKSMLLISALLGAGLSFGLAQDTLKISRTIAKLSPQHFIDNSLKAGIERFNKTHSGSIAFFITGRIENEENNFDIDGHSGIAGELQFRKYISPMKTRLSKRNNLVNQGIYGAAYLQGGSYSGDFEGENFDYDPNTRQYTNRVEYAYKEKVINYGFGFTIGFQKSLWQVIFLDAYIGGGIQFADNTVTGTRPDYDFQRYSGIGDPTYKGILPKIGFQIGIGL